MLSSYKKGAEREKEGEKFCRMLLLLLVVGVGVVVGVVSSGLQVKKAVRDSKLCYTSISTIMDSAHQNQLDAMATTK